MGVTFSLTSAGLVFFAGVALGSIAATLVLWLRRRAQQRLALSGARSEVAAEMATLGERLCQRDQRLDALEQHLGGVEAQLDELRRQNVALERELARAQAEVELSAQAQSRAREAETQLGQAFSALAASALRSNNEAFLQLAAKELQRLQDGSRGELKMREQAIETLVKPLAEGLTAIQQRLAALERDRVSAYAGLSEQVRSLAASEANLLQETNKLTKALQAPTVRGRWGEIQLRRVAELAGMTPHCDFSEQPAVSAENGARLQPDMVVHLPGGRDVVIDAKAPMSAYLEAHEAADEPTRRTKFKLHAQQLRQHVTTLSSKGYWQQFAPAPQFVVLFLPADTFFATALEHDPSLIEFAAQHQVVLTTPSSLIALLRSVALGWSQQQLADNARAISDLGRQLHDRLQTLSEHVSDMRGGMLRAVESYNRMVGSLEGRVMVSARRLKDLGVHSETEIRQLDDIDTIPRTLRAPDA